MTAPLPAPEGRASRRTAILCGALAAGMLGLAYASVPLYDLFCRMTGFDGTPIVRKAPTGEVLDRRVAVRFDANVAPGLPWRFQPEEAEVTVRLGEPRTVLYRVTNTASTPTTGIASFNVQPSLMGAYFIKLQCFCFTEQTLQPGETVESAVVFYVDPDMAKDPNTRERGSVTLSYTYFPVKAPKPVAAVQAATPTGAN